MYEAEFLDGEIRPYAANLIAKNIWLQVYPEGQHYIIFEFIIDCHVDSNVAISKENMYLVVNSCRTMQKSTVGVKLLVLCKDESKQWFPLKALRESNPVECAEYAKATNIDMEPAFCWWIPYSEEKGNNYCCYQITAEGKHTQIRY